MQPAVVACQPSACLPDIVSDKVYQVLRPQASLKVSCCPQLLQAGEWSSEGHWCFPPAFRAAVRQLLLISHKYGGVRRQDGQLRWPFRTEELVGLLLPVMGRGSMTAWVTP